MDRERLSMVKYGCSKLAIKEEHQEKVFEWFRKYPKVKNMKVEVKNNSTMNV